MGIAEAEAAAQDLIGASWGYIRIKKEKEEANDDDLDGEKKEEHVFFFSNIGCGRGRAGIKTKIYQSDKQIIAIKHRSKSYVECNWCFERDLISNILGLSINILREKDLISTILGLSININ